MTTDDNPCLACSVDQNCCKAHGLKLSRREYEKLFKKYSSRLSFVKYNKMLIAFPRDNQACPYWNGNGCSIYADRPIDCRLFPFELNRMVEKNNTIEMVFYDQTDCPQKESLFIPVDEAKEMMTQLARDVYGPGKTVSIHYEPGKKPPRSFGFLNPVIAWLSRLIRTCR